MKMSKKKLLGKKVKDIVSGFEGVAVSKIEYMNGCTQYNIQPKCKDDNTMIKAEWFDAEQVELVSNKTIVKKKKKPTGGPSPGSEPILGR
jgi:hypothetical protein